MKITEKATEVKNTVVDKVKANSTKIKVGLGVLAGAAATAVAGVAIWKGVGDVDDYIDVVGEAVDDGVIDDVVESVTEVAETIEEVA